MGLYSKLASVVDCTINGEKYERKIEAADVTDATAQCPTCGQTGKTRKPVCKIQDDPLVTFLFCDNCKGNSASMMPTDAYLANYYSKYYEGDGKQVTFPGKIKRFAAHIAGYLKFSPSQDAITIMDFGGGDGSIAIEIGNCLLEKNPALKKVKVLLVDYQLQEPFTKGKIEFDSVATLDEVKEKADLVFASAILEHIPDLHGTMQKLVKLISKGGYFYARVPYIMPFKRIFKGLPVLYPMHVHDLGPSFWNRIIERYTLPAKIVVSHPPLSETEFSENFLYTLLGHLSKAPARLDIALRNPKDLAWNYVAGWEYMLRVNPA